MIIGSVAEWLMSRTCDQQVAGSNPSAIWASRSDGKRPDGLTLVPWQSGRSLVWDVTVVCPLADSYVASAAREARSAAEFAATKKEDKYSGLAADYLFCLRAFAVAGPRSWNSLPPALRSTSTSFTTFKKELKSFLFGLSFCLWHRLPFIDYVQRSAAVCSVDCAIEIVLITLHYITLHFFSQLRSRLLAQLMSRPLTFSHFWPRKLVITPATSERVFCSSAFPC